MRIKHRLLLYWLLLAAAIAVAAAVLGHLGLFRQLVNDDVSRLSSVIIVVFCAASLHAAIVLVRLSRSTEALQRTEAGEAGRPPDRTPAPGHPDVALTPALRRQIRDLRQARCDRSDIEALLRHANLLESFRERIKAPARLGWLLADLLIKLGLLGTVIGFILMLGAISEAETIDVSNIQPLLTDMGSGMRVALLTTLCGLTGGTLLGFQYFIVERAADELIDAVTEVVSSDSSGAGPT